LSYLADTQTDRQTNKQTNKVWQKHNLLGGGNYKVLKDLKGIARLGETHLRASSGTSSGYLPPDTGERVPP